MRKLRERLRSKKGFTLVELIVVIVIILILAAVLIPNVMRYIGQARESTFQSEASGYLTEVSGYAAEHFAKYGTDVAAGNFGAAEAQPTNTTTGGGAVYPLTGFGTKIKSSGGVTVYSSVTSHPNYTENADSDHSKTISVTILRGAVLKFSYNDGTYVINWTQNEGWGPVIKKKNA